MVTKIDENAKLKAGCIQIIDDLSTVLVHQLGNGFELGDDLVEADQVRFVGFAERVSLVAKVQTRLSDERDRLHAKLHLQALLINRFQESAAFLLVHLEAGPDDPVAFLFVDQAIHKLTHGELPAKYTNDTKEKNLMF